MKPREQLDERLAAGDVIIVDGGMVAFLVADWTVRARRTMHHPGIYVHDRKTFALQRAP